MSSLLSLAHRVLKLLATAESSVSLLPNDSENLSQGSTPNSACMAVLWPRHKEFPAEATKVNWRSRLLESALDLAEACLQD